MCIERKEIYQEEKKTYGQITFQKLFSVFDQQGNASEKCLEISS